MTRTVAYIEDSGVECPNCKRGTTQYAYHLRAGTTFTQFREWSPQEKRDHSLEIVEHCTRCGVRHKVK